MVHGKNRISYRIDQRLSGLAGPDYHAAISFGLPFELGDCPYGKYRVVISTQLDKIENLHSTDTIDTET